MEKSVRLIRDQRGGDAALAAAAHVRIGRLEFHTLSDGYVDLPVAAFGGADAPTMRALLDQAGLAPSGGQTIRTAINAFLVRDEGRVFLIDTGMGYLAGPTLGQLPPSLALAGLQPQDITDVVLTHLHRDHCGGLIDKAGNRMFPVAVVHVAQQEHNYWMDPVETERASESNRGFFDAAQKTMRACEGQLRFLPPGGRLTRRLSTEAIVGHTAGHTGLWFRDGETELCFWGDIVHCAGLQISTPTVTVRFDSDPARAIETRLAMLGKAASQGFWVAGAHIDFPGVGRIARTDSRAHAFRPLVGGGA